MGDTGNIWQDALDSMAAHLDTQKATWEIKSVYPYPAYAGIGAPINSVCLEISPDTSCHLEMFGDGWTVREHIGMRLTYLSPAITQYKQYADVLTTLRKIIIYLVQHPVPDGFGSVLSWGNLQIGELPTAATTKIFIASVDVVLEILKHYTEG